MFSTTAIRAVPFLRANNVVISLKDELPQFIAKAISSPDDFDDQTDILPWWKATAIDLKCWATAAQLNGARPAVLSSSRKGLLIAGNNVR